MITFFLDFEVQDHSAAMAYKFIALFALVACVNAGYIGHGAGSSVSSRQQDDFGNYAFKYQIANGVGATNGRSEAGGPHGVVGSYNIADIDGRARRVDYVADGAGFRAKVHTNEPGTAASFPAAAVINSPYAGNVAVGHGGIVANAAIAHGAYAGAGYGALGYGAYGNGVYGHGAYGHGAYGHGAYGHGAYGHGAYGNGAYGLGYGLGHAKVIG